MAQQTHRHLSEQKSDAISAVHTASLRYLSYMAGIYHFTPEEESALRGEVEMVWLCALCENSLPLDIPHLLHFVKETTRHEVMRFIQNRGSCKLFKGTEESLCSDLDS